MTQRISERELLSRTWDVLVVGTGIGGATLGYALAKAGRSVLFCEKGRSYLDSPDALAGDWLESLTRGEAPVPTEEHRRRAGRYFEQIEDVSGSRPRVLKPMLGIGTGGSSALYGMVMERFFPADFTPARYYREAPGANLPEAWPISFEDLAPYYTQAEMLYRVRASADPLRPAGETRGILEPPGFTPANLELIEQFRAKGLHPYYLPMACEFVPGCQECIGYICQRRCKQDSVTSCLEPALRDHGASLLPECEIDTLDSVDGRITTVNGRWRGSEVRLKARTVVLAAGAVHTPAILLRSGGARGLANGSGQVGRNLMRHLLDYYIVYPKSYSNEGFLKQIALNDLYLADGMKLGTLQSNGRLPPAPMIAANLEASLRQAWAPLALAFPLVRPLVERRIEKMLSGAHVLASFLEDLPYQGNQIALSTDRRRITMTYDIPSYDRARLDSFRRKIASILRPHRFKTIRVAEENRVLGHVCGTCRFGDDPRTSVLDRNNRAHEIENLYVVDGSFLPSSSGTNPSLTIAANALRVAETILGSKPGRGDSL